MKAVRNGMSQGLCIGWTTVDSEKAAQRLALELVESGLAACVQIDPGVSSVYRWKGEVRCDAEWRLMIKFTADQTEELERLLYRDHPYETPEWVVVRADHVDPKYLKWARKEAG